MINVYEKSNYRAVVESLLEWGQQQTPRLTLSEVARRCQVQPSYLSNVLKERGHLNGDQLYELLALFSLSDEDIQYSLDLLEWERSSQPRRRAQLREKIKQQRELKLRSENYLRQDVRSSAEERELSAPLELYYLDPIAPLLHMYFGLNKVDSQINSLAKKFQVSEGRIENLLRYLQSQQLIEFKHGRFRQKRESLHLPKDSPLMKAHQLSLRALALEHFVRSDSDKHYSFMATFNANAETKIKIQVEFLKFIKKCQNLSRETEPETVLQMNFELFNWDL